MCYSLGHMAHKPRLFLLDANALLHRAWHALPPLTNPQGQVVNAVYGVMMVVMKLLEDHKPDAFVACWDTAADTFRHEAYKEYKAQREKQADELYEQIPWIQEGLKLLGVPSFFLDGFEADDLLGTIAMQAKKAKWEAVIVTGDRDALQLIQPGISVMAFKKGVTETTMYDEKELFAQYGLTPEQFIDYKVMRGDPSDNIPGIRGIGEKGATDLLQKFKNLENILKAAHDEKTDLSKSTREKLLNAESEIPGLYDLVRIKLDVPITWEPTERTETSVDTNGLKTFLTQMGFKSLLRKIGVKVEGDSEKNEKTVQEVTHKKSPAAPSVPDVALIKTAKIRRLEHETDFHTVLKSLQQEEHVIVRVMRGDVNSLFAQAIEGLAIADRSTVYVFPMDLLKKSSVLSALQYFLVDARIGKIGHDVKAEEGSLKKLGLAISVWSFDTLLAAYLLSAGERKYDLEALAVKYGLPTVMSSIDVCIANIWYLYDRQKKELDEVKLLPILEKFEMPLVPVLFEMEQNGIKVDGKYLKELAKDLQKEKQEIEKAMQVATGETFNPASPSQLADVLFEKLKLSTKGIKRGKTGYSTAAPELEKLRGSHPIIELIEQYREVAKLLSTYVETIPEMIDTHGRVHTTYNQAIAATGRLSSTDPNLQNIPIRTELGRKIRRAFVAQEGYQLLSCDYSQIELRVVAVLAKDEKMLEAFKRGDDIHTATAASIWGIKKDEVTKDQRRIAKAINFGIIFGQGPHGLSMVADVSYADAKSFIDKYFTIYHGVKAYMDATKAFVRQSGYAETLFGRRRYFPDIQSPLPQLRAQAERMAINMPVQGTDADLMKLAMIAVHKELAHVCPEAKMILQVHDELVFEVPKKDVQRVATFAKETMESISRIGIPTVVEAKAGTNWAEMEKVVC